MGSVVCKLFVTNQKETSRKVGKSILVGGQRGLITFKTIGQLKEALKMQESGTITIETEIPKFLMDQLDAELPSGKQSLQVETVEETYPPDGDTSSLPDTAITKEDVEQASKEAKDEKEVDAANVKSDIPGVQHLKEDAEGNDKGGVNPTEVNVGTSDEPAERDEEANADNAAEGEGGVNPTETKTGGVSADGNSKPEWYLTYQQVEDMSKKDLVKWIEDNKLDAKKSGNAEEVKDSVHEFLSKEYPDHAE